MPHAAHPATPFQGTHLTPREVECLQWAAIGKTSAEIGAILGLAERTANFHIKNACTKLDVCNRQAAITFALRAGYLGALDLVAA
ncbi:helix-turn-helix domain-containing protein [Pusillimonas minor]|uniref:Helix-turn-helix domain-containing protein n=1 Tax=Pusillimonas minor TaxID=2697024 RepID=A0A842HS84_9BURK|nr:helix-turn-helix domain-containing protein [Pusillimonas minor]MBC2770091.1 helix-turn-helix domain-containing protein [Pusillimonas minor]